MAGATGATGAIGPPGPAGPPGTFTIQVGGKTQGVGSILNLLGGLGVGVGCSPDNLTVSCTFSADTAFMESRQMETGSIDHTIVGTSTGNCCTPGVKYIGSTAIPLTLVQGQEFSFYPDQPNLAAATLNLNGVGPTPLMAYRGGVLVAVTGGECPGPTPIGATKSTVGCKLRAIGNPVNALLVE